MIHQGSIIYYTELVSHILNLLLLKVITLFFLEELVSLFAYSDDEHTLTKLL